MRCAQPHLNSRCWLHLGGIPLVHPHLQNPPADRAHNKAVTRTTHVLAMPCAELEDPPSRDTCVEKRRHNKDDISCRFRKRPLFPCRGSVCAAATVKKCQVFLCWLAKLPPRLCAPTASSKNQRRVRRQSVRLALGAGVGDCAGVLVFLTERCLDSSRTRGVLLL